MADVHSPAVRSKNMRSIRGRGTKPEVFFRKLIHAAGFRYRLNNKSLPANPDLFLPKYRAVVLIHGCYWHVHNCPLFKFPSTRKPFWYKKLSGNIARDKRNIKELTERGLRTLVIWECALKGTKRLENEILLNLFDRWIESESFVASIDSMGLTEKIECVTGNSDCLPAH